MVWYFHDDYGDELDGRVRQVSERLLLVGDLLVVFVRRSTTCATKKYNVFYALHFAFLGFYAYATLHAEFHWYGYLAMAIYAFDKLQRIARGVLTKRQVDRIDVVGGGQILRVSIEKPKWASPQLGQYVFLNFPEISKWGTRAARGLAAGDA